MDVLNMNPYALPVRIIDAAGKTDYATVQARRRVTLPPGAVVDTNWQSGQPNVRTFATPTSAQSMVLQQATIPPIPPVEPAPAPAPAPSVDDNTKA